MTADSLCRRFQLRVRTLNTVESGRKCSRIGGRTTLFLSLENWRRFSKGGGCESFEMRFLGAQVSNIGNTYMILMEGEMNSVGLS